MSKKDAIIYTEGKTDWKHIKRAIAALGMDLNVEFNESDKNMGDQTLLKQCKFRAEMEHPIPVIHIFDRDTPNVVNEVTDDKGNYKNWGNNVYSLALPVPEHRTGYTNLCIELYYSDQDLKTQDKNGRRLFLTSEFDENSGKHKENPLLSFGIVPSLKKDSITTLENSKIIDSEVYGEVGNVALTKSDFADYIADGVNPFHNFDFSPFQLLLNQVQQIIEMSKPSVTIFFPKQSDQLIGTPSEQLIVALETIYKVVRLFSMIFIGSTIRYYQSSIVDESDGLSKRVRPIKNLISESFREPSLGTLQTMVRYCYHLVNNDAPDELLDMKDCFSARPQLQSIGSFLDDLERLSPSEKRSVRIANKSDLRKEVLQYIIPEFAQHERNLSEILDSLKDPTVCGSISVATWQAAQKMITDIFSP
ncbi:MAG: hypothetical protein KDE53_06935, partial [Caldilineaceae bacterium]|nr:hypothetical protein [Caldilineaceae bacterium]